MYFHINNIKVISLFTYSKIMAQWVSFWPVLSHLTQNSAHAKINASLVSYSMLYCTSYWSYWTYWMSSRVVLFVPGSFETTAHGTGAHAHSYLLALMRPPRNMHTTDTQPALRIHTPLLTSANMHTLYKPGIQLASHCTTPFFCIAPIAPIAPSLAYNWHLTVPLLPSYKPGIQLASHCTTPSFCIAPIVPIAPSLAYNWHLTVPLLFSVSHQSHQLHQAWHTTGIPLYHSFLPTSLAYNWHLTVPLLPSVSQACLVFMVWPTAIGVRTLRTQPWTTWLACECVCVCVCVQAACVCMRACEMLDWAGLWLVWRPCVSACVPAASSCVTFL